MTAPILNREQSRRVDTFAIEKYGIPGVVLMENAARGAADVAMELLARSKLSGPVTILCGGGNNGGDGYALARILRTKEVEVVLVSVADPAKLSGDAGINFKIAERLKLPRVDAFDSAGIERLSTECNRSALIVDGLLGTGFSGTLKPHLAAAIDALNSAAHQNGIPVLALDLPSGLDCETGIPSQPTVRATVTVTFAARKTGFANPLALPFLGEVRVANIGVPGAVIEEACA